MFGFGKRFGFGKKEAGPANDGLSVPSAAPVGTVESDGEHKGEIYGGIYPEDNKPIWFWAVPRVMDHHAAAAWAKEHGASLPTRKQGDYLMALKDKLEKCPAQPASRDNLLSAAPPCAGPDGGRAFKRIFNGNSALPSGYIWLAQPGIFSLVGHAWCQGLSDGGHGQTPNPWRYELPVLCVKR